MSNIEVDLQPELQGFRQARGRILSCEVGNLTKNGEKFFLGISLSGEGTPFLRMNPLIRQKQNYLELCHSNAEVIVTYRAKKRLIGPVRYWVKGIEKVKHNTSLQPAYGSR